MNQAGQERFLSADATAAAAAAAAADPRLFIGTTGWLYLLAIVNGFNTIVFFVGYFCLSLSIIDISWGVMPLIPLVILLVERIIVFGGASVTIIQIIVFALISIWGLRLAFYIAVRYHGEDARYVELAKFEAGYPQPIRGFNLWLKIFVFQATISVL